MNRRAILSRPAGTGNGGFAYRPLPPCLNHTPAFITRYIVEQALGGVLKRLFEELRERHCAEAEGTARAVLEDPNAYDLDALNKPQRAALIKFWATWQTELAAVRILDPACGSGAFLIEAFDQLYSSFEISNARLEELRGQRTLFDLDRQILQFNLYGVDLNPEAIQICQLSLWIKTATRGKALTSLDHTICEGNSVVSDPAVHPAAFDWPAAFPEVFEQGGFDVVVGNPPYVRQELLTPIKPWLEAHYETFHGMADLYGYFYELGLRSLRPGGLLSFIVTNKWMKAGYGEPLRKFFSEKAWVRSVVDFGHAKQIFEEADVFPGIIVVEKPNTKLSVEPSSVRVCEIPREQLRVENLSEQIVSAGFSVGRQSLTETAWQIENPDVSKLFRKMEENGKALKAFVNKKPLFGIKTGFNQAYLIDARIREELIGADAACESIIKPYLSGRNVKRWTPDWDGLWMILAKSSGNHAWPWAGKSEADAEKIFEKTFPSVYRRFKQFEERLRNRSDKGVYWWELRACGYYDVFEREKLMWQDIGYHSRFCIAEAGIVSEATCFALDTTDVWILAVLNSPLVWNWLWRNTIHGKDEALRLKSLYTERIPIAEPTSEIREGVEPAVSRLIEIAADPAHSDRLAEGRIRHRETRQQTVRRDPAGFRWICRGGEAHTRAQTTADGGRASSPSRGIQPHRRTRANACGRSSQVGIQCERPGQPGLRADAGGDRAHVADRAAANADPAAAGRASTRERTAVNSPDGV
ncbi:MAG: hypothetical protein ACI9VS_002455 [Candidatus Binatia bacterium]|jgi:hypothetical protein